MTGLHGRVPPPVLNRETSQTFGLFTGSCEQRRYVGALSNVAETTLRDDCVTLACGCSSNVNATSNTATTAALLCMTVDPAGSPNTVAGAEDQERNGDIHDHVSLLHVESGDSQKQECDLHY